MSEVVKKEYAVGWNQILNGFKKDFQIFEITLIHENYYNYLTFDSKEYAVQWVNEQIQYQIKIFNIIGKELPKEPYRDIDATDDEFGNEID